jgi:hypothetical protein
MNPDRRDPDPWIATFAHANMKQLCVNFWAYDEIDAHNQVNTMLDTTHRGWIAIGVRPTVDHDNHDGYET